MHFLDDDPDDIDVRVAELLTATADSSDPLVHPNVGEALGLLRRHIGMDVVFVSRFQDHKRTFKVVETNEHKTLVRAGQSDPLEDTWCQHVVDGVSEMDLRRLQITAKVLAEDLLKTRVGADLELQPINKGADVGGGFSGKL